MLLEARTDCLCCELLLVVLQELLLLLGEVKAKVLEAYSPFHGIILEKLGELVNFSIVGGPFSNAGSLFKVLDVVSDHDVGQGGKVVDLLICSCSDKVSS